MPSVVFTTASDGPVNGGLRPPLYSKRTLNLQFAVKYLALRQILGHASDAGVIKQNPAAKVRSLTKREKKRGTLTTAEADALLEESAIPSLWGGSVVHYAISLLAANTGMRIGEIQALQLQHVHLDATTKWIQIAHGWRHVEGISRPKWGLDHPAPIDDKVAKWLGLVIGLSGSTEPEDLVFHGDWISELRRRNLPQHVVRYFAGLPPMRRQDPNPIAALHDRLVRYLTGHQSDATEGCTHVGLDDLTPVSLIKELIAKTNYDVGDGPHKN